MIINPTEQPAIDRELYVYSTYEPGTLRLLSELLQPQDDVLDVGANIGLMTCLAGRLVGPDGRVVAIEPSKPTFAELEANVRLNSLTNVELIEAAAGPAPGLQGLYYRPSLGSGGSTLVPVEGRSPDERVIADTIDRIVDRLQIERVALLKIDIEGFEYQALVGAKGLLGREDPPCVLMEYSLEQPNSAASSVGLLARAMDGVPFALEHGKAAHDYGSLIELPDLKAFPRHDNVLFVPRSKIASLESRIPLRRLN